MYLFGTLLYAVCHNCGGVFTLSGTLAVGLPRGICVHAYQPIPPGGSAVFVKVLVA